MSTYNEYLHSTFKRLGFPDYIKMLDAELRLKDVTFLWTRENLPGAPFFGKYDTEIRFAIVHPPEASGKQPYIGLIQTNLLNALVEDRQQAILHTQLYYRPLPTRQAITVDVTQSFEDHLRHQLSTFDPIRTANADQQLVNIAAQISKRR